MSDIIYLCAIIFFFVLCILYLNLCERLRQHDFKNIS